jgi:starvation-inducible DNA-binding protein
MNNNSKVQDLALETPSDLTSKATVDIAASLTALLADTFALYLKAKNFHWHMSGRHFRDYHLLLDEQGTQIFAMTDPMAERVRKIGGMTLRSIGQISRLQRILDNDAGYVTPLDMLGELRDDNKQMAASMREIHSLRDEYEDVATASLLETWAPHLVSFRSYSPGRAISPRRLFLSGRALRTSLDPAAGMRRRAKDFIRRDRQSDIL